MIFNSLTFLVFFPIVFGLYWFVCGRDALGQNALWVAADSVIRAAPMEGYVYIWNGGRIGRVHSSAGGQRGGGVPDRAQDAAGKFHGWREEPEDIEESACA